VWACSACTFGNSQSRHECTMCRTAKPIDCVASSRSGSSGSSSGKSSSGSSSGKSSSSSSSGKSSSSSSSSWPDVIDLTGSPSAAAAAAAGGKRKDGKRKLKQVTLNVRLEIRDNKKTKKDEKEKENTKR
jgi:hypothetical protein